MAFPSTFKDLQDGVIAKARLADPADRTKAKDWINRVYARICVETEALQDSLTTVLTPGVAKYTLNTAILRIKEIAASPPGGGYGPPLEPVDLEQILLWRQSGTVVPAANQSSTNYALVGMNVLELYPTPATADTLLIYHVYLPAALVNDADLPVLQEPYVSDILEYGALFEACSFKKDPDAADYHTLYEDAKRRFIQHLSRRRGSNVQQIRVAGRIPVALRRDIDVPAY